MPGGLVYPGSSIYPATGRVAYYQESISRLFRKKKGEEVAFTPAKGNPDRNHSQ